MRHNMSESSNIQRMLYDTMILFHAVQSAASRAVLAVGYNHACEVSPGIVVSYDLLDRGPDRIYDDQYREQAEAEYGDLIEDCEVPCMDDKVYHRISVIAGGDLVCRVEGKGGLHMSLHRKGDWEARLVEIYKTTSEYQLIGGDML